jgi:hypothetical protein
MSRVTEPRRRGGTLRDMLLSIGVTLLLVGFLVAVTHRDHGDGVRTVPWRAIASQVAAPLQPPADLPAGSRATSARLTSGTHRGLHIGTLTKAGHYVALEAAATTAQRYLDEVLPAAKVVGVQTIGDVAWSRRQITTREGHVTRALVRQQAGVTVVVAGTGSWDELAAFVASGRL